VAGSARRPGLSVIVSFPPSGAGCMLSASNVRDGKDAMEPGFAASEIDTTTPHPARMYDALLGGKDHYRADQEAVRRVLKAAPEVRPSALANRAFMQRVVRFLVGEAGIRQIIDIGTGIPAAGNVHQVAAESADWRAEDHQRFDRWLAGLFRYAYAGREAEVVTVLIDTSREDRVRWYSRLRERQAVYDRRGATTQDPAEFGDFTDEIQQQLRVIATRSQWPLVENRGGKDPFTTAREILAVADGTQGMCAGTGWPR
jgi:S-adenosyl methyltransferase